MATTKTELRRAVRTLGTAQARRDLLIRRLRDDGLSLREIGAIANLSAQGVKLICDTVVEG